MKVAIVSHMPWDDPYGAATSLRLTTEALTKHQSALQLMVVAAPSPTDSSLGTDGQSDPMRTRMEIIRARLPMEIVCHGFSQPAPAIHLWNRMVRARAPGLVTKRLLPALASVDLIHLNSMTLAWVAGALQDVLGSRCPPITLHVRESALPTLSRPATRDFRRVSGFVAIDETVRTRLWASVPRGDQRELVLPNLVSEPASSSLDEFAGGLRECVDGRPILAMTGRVSPDKGVAFVAGSIAEVPERSSAFLIVGARSRSKMLSPQSHREIKKATKFLGGSRAIYLGEIPSLGPRGFYKHVDVLIRGDSRPGVGRNVYEALIAGSSVIVPGTPEDYEADVIFQSYAHQVYFAQVRSTDSYATEVARALRERPSRSSDYGASSIVGSAALGATHAGMLLEFWESVVADSDSFSPSARRS